LAGASNLLRCERHEIGRDLSWAEAHEQPVEHGRKTRMVEPGTDHAGHAHQVVAAVRVPGEVSDEAGQPRHVARRPLAVDAMAAAAAQRPVEPRPLIVVKWRSGVWIGSPGRCRREQDNGEHNAPAQASPIRTALEQW
jgi:hypothetical protein